MTGGVTACHSAWALALAACAGSDTGPWCSLTAAKTALADSLAWEVSDRLGRAAQDLDVAAWGDSVEARKQRALAATDRRYRLPTLPRGDAMAAYFRRRRSVLTTASDSLRTIMPLFAAADSLREDWLIEVGLAEEYAAARQLDVERLRIEAAEAGLLCEGR